MKINGNITINNKNYEKYKGITEVSGTVDVRADNASFPALAKSGSVDVRADNASFPALVEVSGYVDVSADNASFPALVEVSGYVYVSADNASFPALVEVSGSVYVRAENASFPALVEVSGDVYVRAENASFPALTKSGDVYVRAENASFPALTSSVKITMFAPIHLACPKTGEFEAWKKCQGDIIVKLLIPADARRSSAESKKCRAEFVDVLEIIGADTAISKHDGQTLYEVGKRMKCHKWDSCRWNECSGGIHFFMNREEAEAY